jgi:hypothetical protein
MAGGERRPVLLVRERVLGEESAAVRAQPCAVQGNGEELAPIKLGEQRFAIRDRVREPTGVVVDARRRLGRLAPVKLRWGDAEPFG